MQSSKLDNKRSNKHKSAKAWRPTLGSALIIFFAAMSIWLFFTIYVLGQLDFKQSDLILKWDGCSHLAQFGISLQQIPGSDSCQAQVPFRANLFDAGGRIELDEQTIRIPECQLVSYRPLKDQHWIARHWPLTVLEFVCAASLLFSMWLLKKATERKGR